MKVMVEYAIGYSVPEWMVVESNLADIRHDTCNELISRRQYQRQKLTKGWAGQNMVEANQIHNKLRVVQILPENTHEQK